MVGTMAIHSPVLTTATARTLIPNFLTSSQVFFDRLCQEYLKEPAAATSKLTEILDARNWKRIHKKEHPGAPGRFDRLFRNAKVPGCWLMVVRDYPTGPTVAVGELIKPTPESMDPRLVRLGQWNQVRAHLGYVESNTTGALGFTCDRGFDTPLDLLQDLSKTLRRALGFQEKNLQDEQDSERFRDCLGFLLNSDANNMDDCQRTDYYGGEVWETLDAAGWSLWQGATPGLGLFIAENGEKVLWDPGAPMGKVYYDAWEAYPDSWDSDKNFWQSTTCFETLAFPRSE